MLLVFSISRMRVRSQLAKEFPLSEELPRVYEVEPGTGRKEAVILRLLVDDKVVGCFIGRGDVRIRALTSRILNEIGMNPRKVIPKQRYYLVFKATFCCPAVTWEVDPVHQICPESARDLGSEALFNALRR
jgi:hypothetical protein